jgi:uncharacterized protein YkwD
MLSKIKLGLLLFSLSFIASPALSRSIDSEQLLKLVNKDRIENGQNALKFNQSLTQAALAKASDMASNDYFDHISPRGARPWDFMQKTGISYVYAGENLALNFEDALELEQSWMNSPSHRNNILSPYYTDMGLAVVNKDNQTYIVQFFAGNGQRLTYSR